MVKNILKKNTNKMFTLQVIETYYKDIVIITWFGCKIEKQTSGPDKSPDTETHIHSHLITRRYSEKEGSISINVQVTYTSQWEQTILDPYHIIHKDKIKIAQACLGGSVG